MPVYCGKRSAGIWVVLGPKKSSTYCREYASGFLEPAALHLPTARCAIATMDYADRLLAGRCPVNQRRTIRIGVIADTHGLFDPAVRQHFKGVDHILHAGDIGNQSVIDQLQAIAPVTAVSGNVDGYEQSGFPSETVVILFGIRVGLRHVVYEGGKLTRDGRAFLDREQPDICIFGHTHQPKVEWFGKILLFNPGSAGPKRFRLPRGLGVLVIAREPWRPST